MKCQDQELEIFSGYQYLCCRRRGKDEDVGAAGVLGGGELAVAGRLAEPLVGRELVGHEPQAGVGLHGDEAGGHDGGHVARPLADLAQLLRRFLQGLATQQDTPT